MSKQRIIGSLQTMNKIKVILTACTIEKNNLTKANANRDKLSITDLVEAIEEQLIPLADLYDTLMALELVAVDTPAQEPTKTITLEKYTDTPARHQHDCTSCTYLGGFDIYDLYYCPQGGKIPTVIARFGDEGDKYISGIGSFAPSLIEAERRAKELGLIK